MGKHAVAAVVVLVGLTACGGAGGGGGSAGGGGGAAPSSTSTIPTTTTTTTLPFAGGTTTTTMAGGGVVVEEGYCATGTYELDGTVVLEQSAAASGGGAVSDVGGAVVLELRDDLTALLDMQDWAFRLFFPDETDTVLGTQSGQMTGTWNVDGDGNHSIEFTEDGITASFVLETAQGPIPVPAGDKVVPSGELSMAADCRTPDISIIALDQALGVEIEWPFARVG